MEEEAKRIVRIDTSHIDIGNCEKYLLLPQLSTCERWTRKISPVVKAVKSTQKSQKSKKAIFLFTVTRINSDASSTQLIWEKQRNIGILGINIKFQKKVFTGELINNQYYFWRPLFPSVFTYKIIQLISIAHNVTSLSFFVIFYCNAPNICGPRPGPSGP